MNEILNLTLKKKWYDLILFGEKKEEYRDIKDYWVGRLIDCNTLEIKKFKLQIEFNPLYDVYGTVNLTSQTMNRISHFSSINCFVLMMIIQMMDTQSHRPRNITILVKQNYTNIDVKE